MPTTILWHRPAGAPRDDLDVRSSGCAVQAPGHAAEALVEVHDPGRSYVVLLRLAATATHAWRLTAVEVRSAAPGGTLDADVLRTVPLEECLALASEELAAVGQRSPAVPSPVSAPARERRPARTIDEETLRTAARVYREALASSVPRERLAPTAAVARALGLNRHDAGRLVSRARQAGMLNPAIPRRPGEVPSERPPADQT
ncbi:hypothetical protein LQ327_17910 [Actinomycetospora endophytica]|uniref:Uncharacterized protein n=1 Tax=Actinomycetospora endophytica TaxID=2291215 RepID=A0ABS8PBF3_9PSEU|nr:hypothetical protein [Actinomycetospora endophytica]MCD2195247.1 hypothetical protein [Actinomycetospora endophytica]